MQQSNKFIVDAMLGTLAKWLRMMGYDTLYSKSYNDAQILSIAARTGRIIITSDKGLHRRASFTCVLSAVMYTGRAATGIT